MVWTCGEGEGNLGKQHMTLLEIVKRKLRWFGHVVRVKGTLANNI